MMSGVFARKLKLADISCDTITTYWDVGETRQGFLAIKVRRVSNIFVIMNFIDTTLHTIAYLYSTVCTLYRWVLYSL